MSVRPSAGLGLPRHSLFLAFLPFFPVMLLFIARCLIKLLSSHVFLPTYYRWGLRVSICPVNLIFSWRPGGGKSTNRDPPVSVYYFAQWALVMQHSISYSKISESNFPFSVVDWHSLSHQLWSFLPGKLYSCYSLTMCKTNRVNAWDHMESSWMKLRAALKLKMQHMVHCSWNSHAGLLNG